MNSKIDSEHSFIRTAKNIWRLLGRKKEELQPHFEETHLLRRKYIMSHACAHFKKNKHEPAPLLGLAVLDIGCGMSKMPEDLTFRGAEVTAIDINPKTLEAAKSQAEHEGAAVEFVETTPEKLLQTGQKFDIIICTEVFEQIQHISRFIWAVSELLENDGIFIFSGYNRSFKSALWHKVIAEWLFGWKKRGTYNLKAFRTPKNLQGKLENKGFKVTNLRQMIFNPKSAEWERCEKGGIRYLGTAEVKHKKTS